MCKESFSGGLYDFLKNHIEEIEREKNQILKKYYNESTEENMDVTDFFNEYTFTISEFLSGLKTRTAGKDEWPFVIIGSIAEVQDIDDMETYQYRIVLPYYHDTEEDEIECASCLSPLGKELLLKKVSDKVVVEIPTGTLNYVVKKIIVPKDLTLEFSRQSAACDKKAVNME